MGDLLELYQDDMDSDKWEKLCDDIYRLKYGDMGYHYVPSRNAGDCGIEGYTDNGIVYQCYYPDGEYSPNDLYEKLRDKMTEDLKKIIKYENKLKKIGVTKIKEWHFIIPNYEDKRILEHKTSKTAELRELKKIGKIEIIDDEFKISIKTLNDFKEELSILVYGSKKYKVTLPDINYIDWNDCPAQMNDNIKRKIGILLNIEECEKNVDNYNKLVKIYMDFYIKGIKTLDFIKKNSPQIYDKIISLKTSCRNDIEIKCLTNIDKNINKNIFDQIILEFENKLKKEVGMWIKDDGIGMLKQQIIAEWLAECPLDFVE